MAAKEGTGLLPPSEVEIDYHVISHVIKNRNKKKSTGSGMQTDIRLDKIAKATDRKTQTTLVYMNST